jgi:hypothetical protein
MYTLHNISEKAITEKNTINVYGEYIEKLIISI